MANCIAFTLYFFLTYLMVYLPVSIDLSKSYLGQGEVVFWSNYFWWFEYSISNLINPLWDSSIFYPMGLGMSDGIFPMFLFVPITKIFGSVVSYNLYFLSSFLLSGYGMFTLSRYLTKDVYVSFVAGIVFAFFPFHFGAGLGHLHTFSIMWVPFFVMYLLKMYEKPVFINIVLAALFFAINAQTSWTITIMLTIFSVIYVLFNIRYTFSKTFFPKIISFFFLSVLLMLPGLYLMLSELISNEHMGKPLGDFIYYSADILAFITPSPLHPVFGAYSTDIYNNFSGNFSENIMFVGYTVIILSVMGSFFCWKDKFVKFILFTTVLFFILSLGPVLHIFGNYKFTDQNLTVVLPGFLVTKIPVLDMVRVPSRYFIMFMFGMSILSAYGLRWAYDKFPKFNPDNPIIKPFLIVLISSIILFEYMAALPVRKITETPDFYHSLRDSDDRKPILELPINLLGARPRLGVEDSKLMIYYYEYQKTHQKPFLGGYWSRVAPQYQKFLYSDPVLSYLLEGKGDILNVHDIDPLEYLQKTHNVSHVILHKSFLPNEELASFVSYLGDDFKEDNSVKDDPLLIYSLEKAKYAKTSNISNTIKLGEGWHGIDYWGDARDIPTRWMANVGELIVNSNRNQKVNLTFKAYSVHIVRTLQVQIDNTLLIQQKIPIANLTTVSIPIQLKEGNNTIMLRSLEDSERPCDRQDLRSNDCRDLSVAIQNISISAE